MLNGDVPVDTSGPCQRCGQIIPDREDTPLCPDCEYDLDV